MQPTMTFVDRDAFRDWLGQNCLSDSGVWLLFSKSGETRTLTAAQALEEALCFGWIDGQLQRIDETSYKKYFSPRRENSKWSQKNRVLAQELERAGLMTVYGKEKMEEAKRNGQWDAPQMPAVTEAQIDAFADLLRGTEPAHSNFSAMPPSVKKTYTRAYLDAKTDAGRAKRLSWAADRLNKNLKPM